MLTQQQLSSIKLIDRSPDKGEGWRKCSQPIFEKIIIPMPDELVEKDTHNLMARLTPDGQVIAKWC